LITLRLQKEYPDFTTRQLLTAIKKQIAPSHSSIVNRARRNYTQVLEDAARANTKPEAWYLRWLKAYHDGILYDIPEAQGLQATQDFIRAIGTRMAPDWAHTITTQLVRLEVEDQEPKKLEQYAAEFMAYSASVPVQKTTRGAYTTIQQRSESALDTREENETCPCGTAHRWETWDCFTVRNAFTGKGRRLTKEHANQIRQKILKNVAYEKAKKKLIADGIIRQEGTSGTNRAIVCATIDPQILESSTRSVNGIYTIVGTTSHPLSTSTLLDNCGAIHLVNNRSLLQPGTFEACNDGSCVEAGASSFPIIGWGKRILKNIFMDEGGMTTIDLVLMRVAVVPNFHVNIVSESLLREGGPWYVGFDCTLRIGEIHNSIIVKRLERKHNLTFLEYKSH